jgi:cytochrome c peroxidase
MPRSPTSCHNGSLATLAEAVRIMAQDRLPEAQNAEVQG